ncbi:class B sortase [Peptococcus simiae]|uniref:Class B sortase n=1 Tax=Peptococcus simiae TaxID=1643805 RepID=A0ABW9GWC1_9FIRM
MHKKVLLAIKVGLLLVILFSGYKIVSYYLADHDFTSQHEVLKAKLPVSSEAETLAGEKAGLEAESVARTLADLRDRYPDIIGWIQIPGTKIDLPIVQGQDNAYYLDHSYTGAYHPFGEVFMDKANQPDLTDQNTILYGHNVQSGQVFHDLEGYQDQAFRDAHPTVHIYTPEGRQDYQVVAVYIASPASPYRAPNYSLTDWQTFRNWVAERNLIQEDLPADPSHPILTLSTCSDTERLVVQAQRVT